MIITDEGKYIIDKSEQILMKARCSGKTLEKLYPSLVKEWNYKKNGDITPDMVTPNSHYKIWWIYHYHDTITGKHFDFEWQSSISDRARGKGCPFLSRNPRVWPGFNDLATVNPELAKEWHPSKNGDLKPTMITRGYDKKVWWLLHYFDERTNKYFDFEWEASVDNRCNKNTGCPFLSGKAIYKGFNDFESLFPNLSKDWHPTKNNGLKPDEITCGHSSKVWWYFPYDDEITGKHFDFEWEDYVSNRIKGAGCPFLSINPRVWFGFNDLTTTNPELAKEWHPTKNGNLLPSNVTKGYDKRIWWYLPYDDEITGKHFDFEWREYIYNREKGYGCPVFSGNMVWPGFNDLATVNPKLAKEWHPTKNGNLKPENITVSSGKKVWWYLPYDDKNTGKHFDFEWKATPAARTAGTGCPYLTHNPKLWIGFNDLATVNPKLAKEWHPTKNGKKKPSDFTVGSTEKVWWYLSYYDVRSGKYYDYEWKASIADRANGNSCPYISASRTEQLLYKYLLDRKIDFVPEKEFKELRKRKSLPFDIYISANNKLIELDGIQHFESVKYFGGKAKLKIQKENDCMKNKFCKVNSLCLLRIPYILDPNSDKELILRIVDDFLETGKVDKEIYNFYSQYQDNTYCNYLREMNMTD